MHQPPHRRRYQRRALGARADFILATFKDLLPSNSDVILGGRTPTRNVTLIPIASAASSGHVHHRRSRALASWQLQEQAEALEEDEADPLCWRTISRRLTTVYADADVAFVDELQAGALAPALPLTEWRAHVYGRGCYQHHTTQPLPPRRPAASGVAGAPPGEGEGWGRGGVGLGLG